MTNRKVYRELVGAASAQKKGTGRVDERRAIYLRPFYYVRWLQKMDVVAFLINLIVALFPFVKNLIADRQATDGSRKSKLATIAYSTTSIYH